ncbi:hypothetical protein B0181_06345 [Moraxella caviae]|uniref:RDD family n=1 Tax=Moraxella caviae TaxID=34060 RepID=A0A1T0A1Q6_9GAMM|nr:RDD family protein [Moraxella caviae]OOR89588.1 hypothetical protein B0181_06345 [Moraxella caviae]STZ10270.1 RDD family [Moraxella caviae]VEW11257.1 RDD family [Moraxella caviae]
MNNLPQPPNQPLQSHPAHNDVQYVYAGFWARFFAQIIDGILIALITVPALYLWYGDEFLYGESSVFLGAFDVLVQVVLPFVAVMFFWTRFAATPGKMLFGLQVRDAKTGNLPTLKQAVLRYFGYIVSGLVLFLGYIWAAFDKQKQTWHDKIAKTVVVRER